MGLDMYLRGEKFFWTDWKNPSNNRTEDGFKVCTLDVELGYWRKHPDLHGFIVTSFAEGEDNCQRIDLDSDDIDKIIAAINGDALPPTTGFFFGESQNCDAQKTEAIAILQRAKQWIAEREENVSRTVYYRASW